MLNILKTSYNILKNNLIFIQPLLLFLLIFMTALSYIANKNMYFVPKIILSVSLILLFIAFSAGWFYIIKNAIEDYKSEDEKEEIAKKSILNFKKFFEGVGIGFFQTFFAYVILFLIYAGVMVVTSKLCVKFFGIPNFVYEIQKMVQASSQAELFNLLNSVSIKDKLVFSAWVIVVNIAGSVMNFFILLYFAVLAFSKSNILKSFWLAVKFGFKNILGSLFILMFIFCLYVFLNVLSVFLGMGVFGLFLLILLFCAYLNYYVILVFCFYNERTKNNSNNGAELIREN